MARGNGSKQLGSFLVALVTGTAFSLAAYAEPICLVSLGDTLYRVNAAGTGGNRNFLKSGGQDRRHNASAGGGNGLRVYCWRCACN